MRKRLILLFFTVVLYGGPVTKAQISSMLIFGMQGLHLSEDPKLEEALRRYPLGGVILFGKNLKTAAQVRSLTERLQRMHASTLLIGIDQEGGSVDRLAKIAEEAKTPSATDMARQRDAVAKRIYRKMAKRLHTFGFNLNFAPVVDLCANPKNRVIVKNRRCFATEWARVAQTARIFIDAHYDSGLLCTLKHFPGHGSSMADSHKGFTDVTDTWRADELQPYRYLIDANRTDLIMSGHIFNRHLDPRFPATLSYAMLTDLLRKRLHFRGVVVSDDMQMGAITKNYRLEEALTRAVNAGCDMLLFGNQLAQPLAPQKIIDMLYRLVEEGKIAPSRIEEANRRIRVLKSKINFLIKKVP